MKSKKQSGVTRAKPSSSRSSSSSSSRSKSAGQPRSRSAHPLTDHEEIRSWAEERGAIPTCVRGTGGEGDVGMIRLEFPGTGREESLEEISWEGWFEKFDENDLALMVQHTTARGEKNNFNKLVKRATAERKPKTRAAR